MLIAASILLLMLGILHSYLGERYILNRLFKRGSLPHLYGGEDFTKGTLRFAWHITSLAWFGIAFVLAFDGQHSSIFLLSMGITFLLSALFAAFYTKGKHFSWLVFLSIGVLILLSERS
jgi:hypothetical protein